MENQDKGFTKVPHSIGDVLSLLDLTAREFRVAWLIIRLIYGCHTKWARIILADLQAAGISQSHAKEVRNRLLEKEILLQNGNKEEYRLNTEYKVSISEDKLTSGSNRLRKLISKHLAKESSQNRYPNLPQKETSLLPEEESYPSQNGNIEYLPNEEHSASKKQGFSSPKDILNIAKYTDRKRIGSSKVRDEEIDPDTFEPQNPAEYEMITTYRELGDTRKSFPFYLWALYQGLPAYNFRELREDILGTPNVENKGALFVVKVKEYFKNAA